VENYKARYGEPCPDFFVGSLESAKQLACLRSAKEVSIGIFSFNFTYCINFSFYQRKLLAIYLHHGKSILINVFCDQLMKHESIIQTFKEKFVLYGWDMTYESNKDM